jgi:hypothetical protein
MTYKLFDPNPLSRFQVRDDDLARGPVDPFRSDVNSPGLVNERVEPDRAILRTGSGMNLELGPPVRSRIIVYI